MQVVTKDELLAKEAEAWARFEAAARGVPEGRRTEEGVVPGWSTHDLIWHNGFWAGYVADVLARLAAAGPGMDEHDDAYWDGVNDRIAQEAKAMSWDEAWARAEAERERARTALTDYPGEPSEQAATEFADETYVHYDEHTAEVEAFIAK